MADYPDWQREVRAQVVIGTASTLNTLLDRGILDPSNVTAFVVDLGNDDSSVRVLQQHHAFRYYRIVWYDFGAAGAGGRAAILSQV